MKTAPATSKNSPIFVVGAPRSGTTLLAAMLGSHSRIACGPETQFFHKLNASDLRLAVQDPAWPEKAVDLITSLTLSRQKVYELFNLSRKEITSFLSMCKPSIRVMLEALTAAHAEKSGKKRWAEKTPNHLLHLDRIRREFPLSPIIRIVRDPRDSAVSMRKLPWTSDSMIANCYVWDEWFQRSRTFFECDDQALTLRYEDLVLNPERELRNICEFVREPFENGLLNTVCSGIAVSSPKEPWKSDVSRPLDRSKVFAWKKTVPPRLQETATIICRAGIEEFGYECRSKPVRTVRLYPFNDSVIENNENTFTRAAAHGVRLVNAQGASSAEKLLAIPDLGTLHLKSILRAAKLVGLLLGRRLLGRPGLYESSSIGAAEGLLNRITAKFIRILARRYSFYRK